MGALRVHSRSSSREAMESLSRRPRVPLRHCDWSGRQPFVPTEESALFGRQLRDNLKRGHRGGEGAFGEKDMADAHFRLILRSLQWLRAPATESRCRPIRGLRQPLYSGEPVRASTEFGSYAARGRVYRPRWSGGIRPAWSANHTRTHTTVASPLNLICPCSGGLLIV